jgi:hypothetical protein
MGWVRVNFPEQRKVIIDQKERGNTNKLIFVGVEISQTFSLASPDDFKPASQKRRVINTSREAPLELTFELK